MDFADAEDVAKRIEEDIPGIANFDPAIIEQRVGDWLSGFLAATPTLFADANAVAELEAEVVDILSENEA